MIPACFSCVFSLTTCLSRILVKRNDLFFPHTPSACLPFRAFPVHPVSLRWTLIPLCWIVLTFSSPAHKVLCALRLFPPPYTLLMSLLAIPLSWHIFCAKVIGVLIIGIRLLELGVSNTFCVSLVHLPGPYSSSNKSWNTFLSEWMPPVPPLWDKGIDLKGKILARNYMIWGMI